MSSAQRWSFGNGWPPQAFTCVQGWGASVQKGCLAGSPKRHEGQAGHVERAVVGVPVGRLGLGAAETDGQVAGVVEVLLDVEHAVQHLGQRGAHLSVAQFARQRLVPRHQGQGLHGGQAVGRGASDDGEGAFGRDEALQDDGKLLGALQGTVVVFLVVEARVDLGVDHGLQGLQIHGVEDVAGIVVEGKDGAVGIPAVAHIPFLHLAAGGVDAELVELGLGLGQQALDGRREEKPVGVWRVNLAQAPGTP